MDKENVYAPPNSDVEISTDGPPLASRWDRLWGALIDGIIAMIVAFPVMYMMGYWEKAMAQTITVTETILLGVFGLAMFAILHGYLLAKYGQTIGKKLVGTRIVSSTSNEILPFWKVFLIRYLPVSVTAQIPLAGQFLVIIDYLFIFRKSKRCIHDLIAGTKVIKVTAH